MCINIYYKEIQQYFATCLIISIWSSLAGPSRSTATGTGTGYTACQKFKLRECPPQQSGVKNNWDRKMPRIVNGTDATPHEFPYVVRITYKGGAFCAGGILNENYILTAAYCLYYPVFYLNATAADYEVIAGDHNTAVDEGVEQIRKVKSIVWHNDFETNVTFDIGLMLLEQPFEFTENVFPPKMPEPDYDLTGQVVTVIGWGTFEWGSVEYAEILQKIELTVLSHQDCVDAYIAEANGSSSYYHVSEGEFCAAAPGKSTCSADSGGPVAIKQENDCYLYVGIVSAGVNCTDQFPTLYVQISKYIDWIQIHTV